MGVSKLRELRQLRKENARLKRVVADLTLDKNIVSDVVKRQLSTRCVIAPWRSGPGDGSVGIASQNPRDCHGSPRLAFQPIHVMLRWEGWVVNRKPVHRLYRLEGLQLRRRVRRRKQPCLHRGPVPRAMARHERLSMEFVHDQIFDGRRFRSLTVIDQWSREAVMLEPRSGYSCRLLDELLEHWLSPLGAPSPSPSIMAPHSHLGPWKTGRGIGCQA